MHKIWPDELPFPVPPSSIWMEQPLMEQPLMEQPMMQQPLMEQPLNVRDACNESAVNTLRRNAEGSHETEFGAFSGLQAYNYDRLDIVILGDFDSHECVQRHFACHVVRVSASCLPDMPRHKARQLWSKCGLHFIQKPRLKSAACESPHDTSRRHISLVRDVCCGKLPSAQPSVDPSCIGPAES